MPNANPFPAPATTDGFQMLSGICSEGEKVKLYTGNLVIAVSIVDVNTIGFPLQFILTYNAQDTVLGPVGNKWRHNYMMQLTFSGNPVNHVTFFSASGRQFGFVPSGSNWVADGNSAFLSATLTNPSPNWKLTFPDNSFYTFNSSGQLTAMTDSSNNATTLTYSGGNLTTITEPTGRTIVLGYGTGSTLVSTVTDPRSKVTTLTYDTTNNNLTSVIAPTGCTLSYGYSTPSNHLVTSRTDPRGGIYSFAYDGSTRLTTVTDSETPAHTIRYAYDTTLENTGDFATASFSRTRLTDARGYVWDYRFDLGGNLWRIIDPLNHVRHLYWDQNQKLLYESAGFPYLEGGYPGPRDNMHNRFRGYTTDTSGNTLGRSGGHGTVHNATYDSQRRMTSSFRGQAHVGVQGNWVGQYGSDGWLLCAFENTTSNGDDQSLPTYVSSIATSGMTRHHLDETGNPANILDPRTPVHATSLRREVGSWGNTTLGSSFTATINLAQSKSFNVSFYTHAVDLSPYFATQNPMMYSEQFGRDTTISVTDGTGATQTYRAVNNAPGYWITFPVTGDATHPITVTVSPTGSNTDARISAICFDPQDSHKSSYTWTAASALQNSTDGLGNVTQRTYNTDGTKATQVDARSKTTSHYYLDTWKNRTKTTDANLHDTLFTFDANGNMLTRKDANLNTWTYAYDDKNRPLSVTDPLTNVASTAYDVGGNVSSRTDANNNVTSYAYTPTNRLASTTDAMGWKTTQTYDGSGNLLTVTDAAGRVTQNQYDGANRLVQTTQPDGTLVVYSYDHLNQLVAVTSPNANQSNLASINLTGAGNLLANPGAETVDPYTSTLAQNWALGTSSTGSRDATVAHTGSASLKLTQGYWSQAQVALPPGATGLLSLWARPDGTANSSTLYSGVRLYQVDGTIVESDGPTTTLPTGSMAWLQLPQYRFNVPGDAQFTRFAADSVRTYRGGTAASVWTDDYTLFALSTAMLYDKEGSLAGTQTPDGFHVSLVRDRYGRVAQSIDARGRVTTFAYDSNGRLLSAKDPVGAVTQYSWDAVGNLASLTDPNGKVTQFSYDNVNQLLTITYADTTTEQFTWDPAGRLATYTNNRNQSRSFTYDNANRLTKITYNTDSSTVQFVPDKVGNVTSRTERNGDVTAFTFDALNRVVVQTFTPGAGSSSSAWRQMVGYDGTGHRVFLGTTTASGPNYDAGHYDTDSFPDFDWLYPQLCNLQGLPAQFRDRLGNLTGYTWDVERNLTAISFPNGTPAVATAQAFDVMNRLVSSTTSMGATSILPLVYSYDPGSNRIGLVAGNDTLDWGVDDAGRLVEESINRFVERRLDRFNMGTLSNILVDPTAVTVSLLPLADTFGASTFNVDRWRLAYVSGDPLGLEVRQQNAGLQLCSPRGYSNIINGYYNGSPTPPVDNYGLPPLPVWMGAEHRVQLTGDFDVQVNFANFQACAASGVSFSLSVFDTPLEQTEATASNSGGIRREAGGKYHTTIIGGGSVQVDTTATTSDTSGQLRVARVGSTLTAYYWNAGTSSWSTLGTYASFITASVYVGLVHNNTGAAGACTFTNFTRTVPSSAYAGSGTYTSSVYDAGRSVTWNSIQWVATVPAGTTLQFQVATSSSSAGPWTYVGPDGTSATYFTASGTSFHAGTTGRYCRYQATLTGGAATPTMSRVDLLYSGTNASSERYYTYDLAGNMTGRVVETSGSTTSTETRTVNNLNQITANQVVAGGTTNWTFLFDNSGNMTQRSDGTNVTTYTWNEDNRLTQVSYVGSPSNWTVSYTYDWQGRVLTRTDSTGTTKFVWNGMDCVQEIGPTGTVTRYYIPDGKLTSIERSGVVYQIHNDALGCVRAVTDNNGNVVSHFEYDAWGSQLSSSSDGLTGGFYYRFVGGLGLRWDTTSSLYYMRARWYDPVLGRFLSRDPYSGDRPSNLYSYGQNCPTSRVDPSGTQVIEIVEKGGEIGAGVGEAVAGPPGAVVGGAIGALSALLLVVVVGQVVCKKKKKRKWTCVLTFEVKNYGADEWECEWRCTADDGEVRYPVNTAHRNPCSQQNPEGTLQ